MALEELNQRDLIERLNKDAATMALLVYTKLCGTCMLAERMLEIVQASGLATLFCKIDLNYAPMLTDEWKVSSVPCLVLIRDGKPERFEYAMQSVDHLYSLIKGIAVSED